MGPAQRVPEGVVDDGQPHGQGAFYPSVGYEHAAVTVVSEGPHFEAHTFEKRLAPAAVSHAGATCTPADIVVRQFRPEDFDQVVTLFKDGMMHYPAHKMHAEFLGQHLDEAVTAGDLSSIETTYIAPGGNFWVATPRAKPNEVVGMVALEAHDSIAGELRRMSVKESHRRHGVGSILILALEEWAKQHGIKKVWLGTGAVMDKARAFYASMGYAQTKTVVLNEKPRVECIVFEKELTKAAFA